MISLSNGRAILISAFPGISMLAIGIFDHFILGECPKDKEAFLGRDMLVGGSYVLISLVSGVLIGCGLLLISLSSAFISKLRGQAVNLLFISILAFLPLLITLFLRDVPRKCQLVFPSIGAIIQNSTAAPQ